MCSSVIWAKKVTLVAGLLLPIVAGGCSQTKGGFMRVGDGTYPAKPNGFAVRVYDKGDQPDGEYQIIGIVYTKRNNQNQTPRDREIIAMLSELARKHGADAIMDIRISNSRGYEEPDPNSFLSTYRSGEAKAIIFK